MHTKRYLVVFVLLLTMIGCTANMGNIPWDTDIKNWTKEQRANFFMECWMAEKANYQSMNAIPNKPEQLVKVLKIKYQILENSRQPIRIYAQTVKSGGLPDANMENEIIKWLRALQTQALYGG